MGRKKVLYSSSILSSVINGYCDNIQITEKQIIKRTWLAAKKRKRSVNGERGSRYRK